MARAGRPVFFVGDTLYLPDGEAHRIRTLR
jgi:hypothetical protein